VRFTFLLPSDDLTGGNRVVATYAKNLIARGHQVTVVCNAPDRISLREQLRALGVGQWRALRDRMQLKPGHVALSGVPLKVLERARPFTADDLPDADVLIATWWETAVWMHSMPPSKGRKVHLIQDYEVWTGGDIRSAVHAALRLPNHKIVISNELKRTLETEVGDIAVTVVPNAVDLLQFDAPSRDRAEAPTVGFMYGKTPRKAADLYAHACELARLQLPNFQVLAFGADLPTNKLPLPTGTEFFLRPPQTELASIYARCDAWLFGSRIDSFGLPILEAMACRTPVIAVPVGAATDLIAGGGGVLVPRESPQAMADAIVRLCTQAAQDWKQMSDCAHATAHGYSWKDATQKLLGVVQVA